MLLECEQTKVIRFLFVLRKSERSTKTHERKFKISCISADQLVIGWDMMTHMTASLVLYIRFFRNIWTEHFVLFVDFFLIGEKWFRTTTQKLKMKIETHEGYFYTAPTNILEIKTYPGNYVFRLAPPPGEKWQKNKFTSPRCCLLFETSAHNTTKNR